eukprot:13501071-Alexandrium_andersonii.AAC.1
MCVCVPASLSVHVRARRAKTIPSETCRTFPCTCVLAYMRALEERSERRPSCARVAAPARVRACGETIGAAFGGGRIDCAVASKRARAGAVRARARARACARARARARARA